VLEAVLFDWGNTLMDWGWDVELLAAGHDAGLRALGRDPIPELTARFRDDYLPSFFAEKGMLEEIEYPAQVRRLLAEFGVEPSDDELQQFLEAEHAEWGPAVQLASTTHALLETLRERGLKLGLVSNAIDPPDLLHRDLERHGITERVDVAVFSSEVGRRKPDPAIYRRALDALGVEPTNALFVGDTLHTDIAGAKALGMHTCQALWFFADSDDEPEPEFRAFTQMDVLTVVSRLGVVSPA